MVRPAIIHPTPHQRYAAIPWQRLHILLTGRRTISENVLRDPLLVHVGPGDKG